MEFETFSLGQLYDVGSGLSKSAKEFGNGGHPFISFKTIFYNYFLPDEILDVANTTEKEQEKCSVKAGDVFLTRTSETMDELGMSCVALKDYPYATFNGFSKRLRMKQGCKIQIYHKYIGYYFRSQIFRNQITSMSTMSTRASLNIEMINRLVVKIPDYDTQIRIGDFLYLLDKKISNNNKINRNLLEQAITVFKEKIWSKDKNGTIGDYCIMKSGFAFKSSWWTDEGVKVIKIGDINQDNLNLNTCSHVDEDKVEKASDYTVKAGDLVLAMTGATIGKFAMVPERNETILVNQRVGKFFLGDDPLKRIPFIYCTLKMDDVYSEVIGRGQGSAQPNISGNDVMTIPCVIPAEKEIDDFNSFAEPIFTSIVKNQNENEQLANLRDSLLPKLMSGELDVSDLEI